MKKIYLILGILMIFSTLAFAKTVTVVINGDSSNGQWVAPIVKQFEKKNPGITVKVNTIEGTGQNYAIKLALMLRSTNNADVVLLDGFLATDFASGNLLAPIQFNKYPEFKHFFKTVRNVAKINGKYYGIPIGTAVRGLVYNKAIFRKAGIKLPWQPKNWAQIIKAAKEIKQKVPGVFPFYMTSVQGNEATSMQTLEMLLYGTNNRLLKDGKWLVQSQGFYNSLKFINTIYRDGLGIRKGIIVNPSSPSVMNAELGPKNKVGIILTGIWVFGGWARNSPKTAKAYALAKMPTEYGQGQKYISLSGGWIAAIAKRSPQKRLAIKFLKFLTNKSSLLAYSKLNGEMTVRTDVAKSLKYPKSLRRFTTLLNYTSFRPKNSSYPLVSKQISAAVEAVALGQLTPKKAMENYSRSVIGMVGKTNVTKLKYSTK